MIVARTLDYGSSNLNKLIDSYVYIKTLKGIKCPAIISLDVKNEWRLLIYMIQKKVSRNHKC